MKYWREKYIHVEKLLKQSKRQAQTYKDKLSDLAERTNETVRSIVHLAQTQLRINESDLRDIQSNNSDSSAITQQSDLSREAQRPIRISITSSSHHPASSRDSSDLSASSSSTSILSTNSEGGTQQHDDHEGFTDSSHLSGTVPMDQANYIKPFQQNMSDRSDRDSDGQQGVDAIPATNNDDNDDDDDDDDRGSTHTITKSVSQHSLTFNQLRPSLRRPSHGDSPESHMQVDELEDLREFREVHQRIMKKYRNPK